MKFTYQVEGGGLRQTDISNGFELDRDIRFLLERNVRPEEITITVQFKPDGTLMPAGPKLPQSGA